MSIWKHRTVAASSMHFFGDGPDAKRYQQSVVEHCGVGHFDVLLAKVSDVVGAMDSAPEPVFDFCEKVRQAQEARFAPRVEPFPDFFEQAYPAYLEALCDQG